MITTGCLRIWWKWSWTKRNTTSVHPQRDLVIVDLQSLNHYHFILSLTMIIIITASLINQSFPLIT